MIFIRPPRPTRNEHGRSRSSGIPSTSRNPIGGFPEAPTIPQFTEPHSDHEAQALAVETGLQDTSQLHEDPEPPSQQVAELLLHTITSAHALAPPIETHLKALTKAPLNFEIPELVYMWVVQILE